MSIGIGAGDIITLSNLAWKCYKSVRDSSDLYQKLSAEIAMFRNALDETKEVLEENQPLSPTRTNRVVFLFGECHKVLLELDELLDTYDGMDTQKQRLWDRFKFGLKDVKEIRDCLTMHTTALSAVNSAISSHGWRSINKKLEKLCAEHRSGSRQGSVISSKADKPGNRIQNDWPEVKRELEDVGIPSTAIEEKRIQIEAFLVDAIESGKMEDAASSTRSSIVMKPEAQDGFSTGNSHSASVGAMQSESSSHDINTRTGKGNISNEEDEFDDEISVRNDPFDTKWEQYRFDYGEDPDVPPQLRPTTKRRRSSRLNQLMFKMFNSEQKIIEAASDGNADEVEKIISLGVNVNTKDKWGWTAMSMAAYGGHEEVTRVLISHGATLDHKDVDGDDPHSLAMKRGHARVLTLIEEENTRRATETDNNGPQASAAALEKTRSRQVSKS